MVVVAIPVSKPKRKVPIAANNATPIVYQSNFGFPMVTDILSVQSSSVKVEDVVEATLTSVRRDPKEQVLGYICTPYTDAPICISPSLKDLTLNRVVENGVHAGRFWGWSWPVGRGMERGTRLFG